MPRHIRPRAPGATIFFTVCLAGRSRRLWDVVGLGCATVRSLGRGNCVCEAAGLLMGTGIYRKLFNLWEVPGLAALWCP
jgi:acyl dehydratase